MWYRYRIACVFVQLDMMNEAVLMAKLDHRNIVRMVGICAAENIMLVLELAALGPLNKYLKKHRSSLQRSHTTYCMNKLRSLWFILEIRCTNHRF